MKKYKYVFLINNKKIELYDIKKKTYSLKLLTNSNPNKRLEEISLFLDSFVGEKIIIVGEPIVFFQEITNENKTLLKKKYKKQFYIKQLKSLKHNKLSFKLTNKKFYKNYNKKDKIIELFQFLLYSRESKDTYCVKKNNREYQVFSNTHYSKYSLKEIIEVKEVIKMSTFENLNINEIHPITKIKEEWLKELVMLSSNSIERFLKKITYVEKENKVKNYNLLYYVSIVLILISCEIFLKDISIAKQIKKIKNIEKVNLIKKSNNYEMIKKDKKIRDFIFELKQKNIEIISIKNKKIKVTGNIDQIKKYNHLIEYDENQTPLNYYIWLKEGK